MGFLDRINTFQRLRSKNLNIIERKAVRNSFFQALTNITAKIGSLIFTIILARMLLPEVFGLYSLVLSTILVFAAISDFGINQTMTRFVSRAIEDKNMMQAKSYFIYLSKIKIFFILISITAILLTANFISQNYYQKPIFLAIIFGSFYVLFSGLFVILKSVFEALNNFKIIFYQEAFFQVIRIFFIPFIAFLTLNLALASGIIVAYIVVGLSLSYLFSLIFFITNSKKIAFLKEKNKILTKKQKYKLKSFILSGSAIIFSGIFFSHIDRIMLGYFVELGFIGYYTVAFTLILASTQLTSFSSALLPVFSSRDIKNSEILYGKIKKIAFIVSLGLAAFIFFFSSIIIKLLFGEEYLLSVNILRLFSVLLVFLPIISISSTYLIAIGKPQVVSKILIISTILNISLNYILISKLLVFGQIYGVYGAVIATIISHFFYMVLLLNYKVPKKLNK